VLAEIEAALKRIDDGTYGICTNCGKEIPPERLEARPWATLCIDCKRQREGR
jgi:DnaK suppressor protein